MFAYCQNNPVVYTDPFGTMISYACLGDNHLFTDQHLMGGGRGRGHGITVSKSASDRVIENEKAFINNTSEDVVLDAEYIAFYKGVLVIKAPFDSSFSFGFIGLSTQQLDSNTLKHEYGHAVQMQNMGVLNYICDVAIPSLMIYSLDIHGKLPYDYYSYHWEADANKLGGATLSDKTKPSLPQGTYTSYWDLISLFFK